MIFIDMHLLLRFIASIITNSIGILIAGYFVPGIIFKGDLISLAITGFVLALANSIIKPILKFISGPLIILTMGLFMVIVNMVILWLVAWLMPELTIVGFWAYVWGVVILAILNAIMHATVKKKS
jgi:putative membrane protein